MHTPSKKTILIILLAGLILAGCAGQKKLAVQEAWGRPALAGGNSAVYFQIVNSTPEDDVLKSAQCNLAEKTEIHATSMDEHDTMTMEPQESVAVGAGSQVDFAPGGLHVMLINLNRDLNAGDEIEVTLSFEKAGQIVVTALIRQP